MADHRIEKREYRCTKCIWRGRRSIFTAKKPCPKKKCGAPVERVPDGITAEQVVAGYARQVEFMREREEARSRELASRPLIPWDKVVLPGYIVEERQRLERYLVSLPRRKDGELDLRYGSVCGYYDELASLKAQIEAIRREQSGIGIWLG